jgi:hypothetical protein
MPPPELGRGRSNFAKRPVPSKRRATLSRLRSHEMGSACAGEMGNREMDNTKAKTSETRFILQDRMRGLLREVVTAAGLPRTPAL